MLVLSRLVGEKLVLQTAHGEVTVTVVDVRGDKVRLGFEAPKDVSIWRSELLPERPPAAEAG